jgi:hypothetical protein
MNLEQVGRNWVAGWNSRDSEAFSRLWTPDGEYVDPSFGIHRTGRSLLRRLKIAKNRFAGGAF